MKTEARKRMNGDKKADGAGTAKGIGDDSVNGNGKLKTKHYNKELARLHAELVKLQMFDRDWGPLAPANPKTFRQHTTFFYRSCSLIEIDIDLGASDSKEERSTDVITKVSMPYIDARPRA